MLLLFGSFFSLILYENYFLSIKMCIHIYFSVLIFNFVQINIVLNLSKTFENENEK